MSVYGKELLILWYWASAGLPGAAPAWVKEHPMYPANNDRFHEKSTKGRFATAVPGRDRLWEAIAVEFQLEVDSAKSPTEV